MKSFEAIFDVPAEHRLVLIKSRAVGGEAPAERWEHEEFDDQGKLVARYQSFVEIDPVMGTMRCGWYRYDADGFLSSWEEDLPDLVAALAPELAINLGQSAAYHSGQASRQFKRARYYPFTGLVTRVLQAGSAGHRPDPANVLRVAGQEIESDRAGMA